MTVFKDCDVCKNCAYYKEGFEDFATEFDELCPNCGSRNWKTQIPIRVGFKRIKPFKLHQPMTWFAYGIVEEVRSDTGRIVPFKTWYIHEVTEPRVWRSLGGIKSKMRRAQNE